MSGHACLRFHERQQFAELGKAIAQRSVPQVCVWADGTYRQARMEPQAERPTTKASRGHAADATFAETYAAKHERAVACLAKDRDARLTSHDLPAEHWEPGRNAWCAHLRTSNPIKSVFATVRHRTVRAKGAPSQDAARLPARHHPRTASPA